MSSDGSRPPDPSTRRHVVLIGLMGSGKTTVGRHVSKRLGRPFHDTDERVVATGGRTIADIFATDGEERFRDMESDALADALGCTVPSVVSTGGGVVLRLLNRDLLADALVVWLRAAPEALAVRLARSDDRPLLQGADPVDRLRTLLADREERYAEVADHVIDVDDMSRQQVIDTVVALVRP